MYLYVNASKIDYLNRKNNAIKFSQQQTKNNNNNNNIGYGSTPNKNYSPQNDRGELKLSLRSLYFLD